MASHHHHHHHQINPLPTTTSCCSFCCSHCCTPPPPPPPPPQTDSLLQALASHLLLLQQQQQPHNLHHQKQQHFKQLQKTHFHQQEEDHHHHPQSQFILSSLLHRIDALESSLQHFSSSSSSTYNHHPSYSLRDTAARVIQTHFRAFLVRRSRTLSQLKHLAFIKSSFNSLKLSISNKTHFDFEAVSHKVMDLLIKLDSIQGGDPMIRDGKRSISRDLVRFLEFIDGFAVKRHQVSYKAAKNVRFVGNSNKSRVLGSTCRNLGGDQREIMEKLRDRVEKISGFSRVSENDEESVELEGFHQVIDDDEEQNPIVSINGKGGVSNIRNGVLVKRHAGQARVKKSVSFADNGNVYRLVSSGGDGTLIDGSDSSEDQGEVENLCNEAVEGIESGSKGSEDDDEVHLEHGGSPQSSDGERNPRARIEVSGDYQGQNKNFLFSAPVPVKMESRADFMKRRALKIVT